MVLLHKYVLESYQLKLVFRLKLSWFKEKIKHRWQPFQNEFNSLLSDTSSVLPVTLQ